VPLLAVDAEHPVDAAGHRPSILGNLVRMSLCTVVLLTPFAAAQARTVAPYSSM
jgi:hypothetical protein